MLALENVEEEKVQRNLDCLEKAGFSRNVFYSPLDLNFFNIVFSSGEIESSDEDHGGLPAEEEERIVHQL